MSLHQRLKAETRGAHDRIEAAFDLDASLATRPAHVDLLGRLEAFHRAFAAAAHPHLAYPGRAEALGAAYVLEGSMLGGVVIARMAERRLGLDPEHGGSFFAGHGRDTARSWTAFCAALDGLADPEAEDGAVAGALRTYADLERHLAARRPQAA